MHLKEFISINEEKAKLGDLTKYIVKNYSQEEVVSKIEQTAEDKFIPSNWEEQADNKQQWYDKYGKNQAEDDVITEIIQKAAKKKGVNLNSSSLADMQNWFYNAYSL